MNKWISVKDELPEGKFLTYWGNQPPLMMVCHFNPVHGHYLTHGGKYVGSKEHPQFTHWMPLPDKPKTTEKSEGE